MGEHAIEFSARFGGKLEHLFIPYGAVAAIYAKENGAGTALPVEHDEVLEEPVTEDVSLTSVESETVETSQPTNINTKKRPSLKVVK